MTNFSKELSVAVGGRGFIPDLDTVAFDMKTSKLEFGDKVFYNSKKGRVEACFFISLVDDTAELVKSHRQTCYVLCMEGSIPVMSKVSSYYLIKANWDNKLAPSLTLTTGYALLNEIEANFK